MLLYLLSILILIGAFKMVFSKNPAYAALYLALCMGLLAGVFFLLGEPFLAGLQLLIYAGAVMVLFVMVLMLFDFSEETKDQTGRNRGWQKNLKWWLPVFLFGVFSGMISLMAFSSLPAPESLIGGKAGEGAGSGGTGVGGIGEAIPLMFTKYALLFEMLGIALLMIAIGVVILNRVEEEKQAEEIQTKEDQTKDQTKDQTGYQIGGGSGGGEKPPAKPYGKPSGRGNVI